MNAPPGMSGSTFCHLSTASTNGLPARRISPILRSATDFIVFSSKLNESSSIES